MIPSSRKEIRKINPSALPDRLESRVLFSGFTAAALHTVMTDPTGSIVSPIAVPLAQIQPADAIPVPQPISPGSANSAGPVLNTNDPTFNWTSVTGITGYQLNLYNITTQTFASYTVGRSITSDDLGGLPAGDSYVWNIRSVDSSSTGLPGTYFYFQTPPLDIAAPVVVSPGSTESPGPVLTTNVPTFTWDAVAHASGYFINVSDITAGTSTGYTVGASITRFTPSSPLVAGHDYSWNVRGQIGDQSGPASASLRFQTPAPVVLPVPTAVSPGSTSAPNPTLTSDTPTLKWDAVTGITGYQINLDNITTNSFTSYKVGTSITSFSPTGLVPGDIYVWNVRSVNGSQTGLPSAYLYFQTAPAEKLPVPTAVSPGSTNSSAPALTSDSPTLKWDAVTGITGYQINLYNLTAGTGTSYTVGTSITSYTPTGIVPGDTYVWNVRSVNGTTTGSPSAYLYFTTAPVPVLPVPTAVSPGSTNSSTPSLTSDTPILKWDAVTGITGYQINLYNLTTNTGSSYTVGASVTSYSPTGLLPGDTYVWNVRSVNGSRTGLPSTYLYFKTAPLVAPVILGPGSSNSPGPIITTLTPTFTWKPVTGVTFDTYQINLYDVTTGVFRMIQVAKNQSSYKLPAGTLTAGNTYIWNLRLKVGNTTGPESQPYLYFVAE
jgi:hypothetical protein